MQIAINASLEQFKAIPPPIKEFAKKYLFPEKDLVCGPIFDEEILACGPKLLVQTRLEDELGVWQASLHIVNGIAFIALFHYTEEADNLYAIMTEE